MKDRICKLFRYSVPEPGPREKNIVWRFFEGLPIYTVIFVAVFGFLLVGLLCLNVFTNEAIFFVTLPLALIVTIFAAIKLDIRLPGSVKERRFGSVVIILLAISWFGLNVEFNAENVYVNRDPGVYNVTARWLMDNNNLIVYGSTIFGNDPAIAFDTGGFRQASATDTSERIYPQAPHLFPAFLGVVGRLGGVETMMKANVAFGALALVALYGLTRFFVRSRWALLTTGVMAISLPMIYFSRDTYTEPLTIFLAVGALSVFFAIRRSKNLFLWAIAGAVTAAATLVRLDAYLVIAAFLAGLFILILASRDQDRRRLIKNTIAFAIGAAVVGLLAWWDVWTLSLRYFLDLRSQFNAQIALISLIAVGGSIVVWIESKRHFLHRFFSKHYKKIFWFFVAIIALFTVFLATRPLWMEVKERGNVDSRTYIASLQARDGQEISPHRNYSENSAYWVVWYIGPMMAVFGIIGLLVCMRTIFVSKDKDGRNRGLVLVVLVFSAMGILYFILPSITADQIWAIRRFLPIVIPLLCVLGAIGLHQLFDQKMKMKKTLIGLTALALLLPPAYISAPFVTHKELAGQFQQLEKLCGLLPSDAAVLVVGSNGINMTQTIRTYCHVPAERIAEPTKDIMIDAAAAARENGYTPVALVIEYESMLIGDRRSYFTEVGVIEFYEMRRELTRPPRKVERVIRSIFLSEIQANGTVRPLKEN
jgi:4-amino-4-deoxy-L-arabinose transferase-like glycosyltransferase